MATNKAQFSIDGNAASNFGYDATISQVLDLVLEDAANVQRVTYYIFDPADPSSPLSLHDALPIYFANGQKSESPSVPTGTVMITMPATSGFSYVIRAVAVTGSGNHVFERLVAIRKSSLRAVVPFESTQYSTRGWADAWSEYVLAVGLVSGPGTEVGQILTWDGAAWAPGRIIIRTGLGTTAIAGLIIHNSTAAALNAQPFSPALVLQGEVWETTGGTRREVYARIQAQGVQGASVTPRLMIALNEGVEGVHPDAAATTEALFLTPTTLNLANSGAGLQLGSFETIRRVGTEVIFGSTNYTTTKYDAVTQHVILVGGATEYLLSATAFDAQNNNILTTGFGLFGSAVGLSPAAGQLLTVSEGNINRGIWIRQHHNTVTAYSTAAFYRSLGTAASQTAVGSTTTIAALEFWGLDTALAYQLGCKIQIDVNGTPGAGSVPMAFAVYTGSNAGSAAQRLSIGAAGGQLHGADAGQNYTYQIGGATQLVVNETTIDAQNNNILTTGNVVLGNGSQVTFDSSPGGTPVVALRLDATENLYLGNSGTNGATTIIYDVKTAGTHAFRINNSSSASFQANILDFNNGANVNYELQGNGVALFGFSIAASSVRRIAVFNNGGGPAGGWTGDRIIWFPNSVAAPTTNTGGGIYLYVTADDLYLRAGAITRVRGYADASTGGELHWLAGDATGSTGVVVGGATVLRGGNCTNTTVGTSQAGGQINLWGGACSGTAGTRTGGDVQIAAGSGNGGTNGNIRLQATPGSNTRVHVDSTGLGFFGATPVAQPSSTGETVGFTAGGGTTVTDASTFTGNVGTKAYRISDIVKHLKNLGLVASS